ncbi:MAG: hypothetical protein ACREDW_06855 [Aestuariivirgaceae bacterium]
MALTGSGWGMIPGADDILMMRREKTCSSMHWLAGTFAGTMALATKCGIRA